MSRLYQFISFAVVIIILGLSGCSGSHPVKKPGEYPAQTQPLDSSTIAQMSVIQKLNHAERLFESALSAPTTQKNAQLSNVLLVCSQVLTATELTEQQLDYTLQLTAKIMSHLEKAVLTTEQNNIYLLTQAAVSLKEYQARRTLELLNTVNFTRPEQLQTLHKLKAMALFQLGQKTDAIKELIIRQQYLSSQQQKLDNQNLTWSYANSLVSYQIETSDKLNDNERIFNGWLELARIFHDSRDPDTLNHGINFWLQNYSGHPADRVFIQQILQARQNSLLNIQQIAVLLPLQGKLAKPAQAIRDGILASHYQSPLSHSLQIQFYDTSTDHIWLTYQEAVDNGADFIIGPLAKSNLEVLAEAPELNTPTLALNSLENTSETNLKGVKNLYQFGLSPESEARQVARKGRLDGYYYTAIIAPDSHWGKRMQSAFKLQWENSGGIVVASAAYDPQAHDFSATIKSLLNIDQSESRKKQLSRTIGQKVEFTPRRRQDIDMLFMAAFPRQAKQIPLQIIYHHGETIPVYSTAHIVSSYHSPKQNIDMDGVLFSDMPFLLGVKQDAVSLLSSNYPNTLYKRLFAMGADSYQIAPMVKYLQTNPAESYPGDTGQMTIDNSGHIIRSMPWATFEQGNVMLLNAE